MQIPLEELARRLPLWEAISRLFPDTALDELSSRSIARQISESGYSLPQAEAILWDEVFPIVECNMRDPAGVWDGFDMTWLQEQILHSKSTESAATRPRVAEAIREKWAQVCRYFPGGPL